MPTSKEKLEAVLQQVDNKAAELAVLKPLKPADEEKLWKKFRLEWNFNSNHIEGNTLTYSETELLLIFDQTPAEAHTLRELEEMKAHDVAVELIRQWASTPERELSEADIRSLNQTILVRPFWKEAVTPDGQSTRRLITVGEYKKQPNSVRLPNGEIFHYTAPEEVQREMGELMEWYRKEVSLLHSAVAAALLHYRFVRIHPFDDGNGRISRLLLNYHLLRNGLPPVVIKSTDKQNYLFALQRADVGDLDAFCVYIAEQLLWSLELSIKAAQGKSVEEAEDWQKEVELLKRKTITELHSKHVLREEDIRQTSIRWFERNFPTLVKAMEEKVGVFSRFFKKSRTKILAQKYQGGETSYSISEISWPEIVQGILEGSYSTRLTFQYEFDDLIDGLSNLSIPQKASVDIFLDGPKQEIRIISHTPKRPVKNISLFENLNVETDLVPINELGIYLFEQIEEALKKHKNAI